MTDASHDQAEELLPWYATGQLDAADRASFERHLATCVRCQRALGIEPVLIGQVRSFAPEIDGGWARLRNRIEARSDPRSRLARAARDIWGFLRRPAVAAVAAAQLAFLAVGAWLVQPVAQPAYVGLGSSQTAAAANVIVMFRPEAREGELRAALQVSGASLVGGPTEADAYMLHVAPDSRAAALAKLRADRNVTLAQPIDGPAQ